MFVLGIDTSCDDTAVAVIQDYKLLSNLVNSQEIHKQFQGIVPELASREHLNALTRILQQALKESQISLANVDLICVTKAPGLIGSLMVGLGFAKGLSYALNIPLVGVHHLEGHLFASHLDADLPKPPLIALVITGGHTAMYDVPQWGKYSLIGATRDDAAGEAFDKAAILMGLGYPGGPLIEKVAAKIIPRHPTFPVGLPESVEFSFSGLKTAVSLHIKSIPSQILNQKVPDIAAALQHAISRAIVDKVLMAARLFNRDTILVAGGVIANSYIRAQLTDTCKRANIKLHIVPVKLATDNGAMIAAAGLWRYLHGYRDDLTIAPVARYPLEEFSLA
jgi:N6-L-threonylcarbamoyladenine synthase